MSSRTPISEEGFIFAGRREVQIEVVKQQINWDSIVYRNLHYPGVGDNLDVLTLYAVLQTLILHLFENDFANLLFGITIHDPEAGLPLHLILQLIFPNVSGHDFDRGADRKHDNRSDGDALQLP